MSPMTDFDIINSVGDCIFAVVCIMLQNCTREGSSLGTWGCKLSERECVLAVRPVASTCMAVLNMARAAYTTPTPLVVAVVTTLLHMVITTSQARASVVTSPQAHCRARRSMGTLQLPRGVVSVVDGFGADPTGVDDSTHQLQRAFTAARLRNITLFLPFGCFR